MVLCLCGAQRLASDSGARFWRAPAPVVTPLWRSGPELRPLALSPSRLPRPHTQVGSIFEYLDRNAVFGVIQPDSPLWAPVLGLFAITGLPTAGFLFFKGVQAANEAAEMQDRIDGYIK
jgi:hypothetical protein